MERPKKRARVHEEIDVHEARRANDLRLKSRFEDIFKKYGRDFGTVGDEIDLRTGEIIVNNGHLQEMDNEQDVGRGLWDDFHPDDDESETENVPPPKEIQSTKLKSRSPHKKPKADNFVTAELLSPGPPRSEHPDIYPVWKTPNIESRFSTTMNITTPTPKREAMKPRPRSPPSSGSIWAASQKRRFQNRRIKRQGQHNKAPRMRRESLDSDDPLLDESVPTPARTPSLGVKKRLDASNFENTVTSDQTDAHAPEHEEPMTQSFEHYHGKAKETMEKGSPSRSAHQPLGEVDGIPHVELALAEVLEAPPSTEIAQVNDAPTNNDPFVSGFPTALSSDHRDILAEQIDINHEDINEPINQESHVAPWPAKNVTRKITTSGVQDLCEVVIYQQAATKLSEFRRREGDTKGDTKEGYTHHREPPAKPPSDPPERPPDKPKIGVAERRNRITELTSESALDAEDPQKDTISRQSPHTSESPSKNLLEILSPHEIKTIVGLRFLQKLPWRKIFETSDIRRPTSRQLKQLYQIRNALAAGGSGEFPPWATEEQDRLKVFLATRIESWDEVSLSFPGKSTAEMQHEWIRVCLENSSTGPPGLRPDLQLGGSNVLPSTPSKYPNVASPAQDLSTPQPQARLDSDDESNRSESPDPLSVAFQRSWIGSGLSAMQIDTPPRPSRSKENNRSPSRGPLASSTKRSSI